MFNILQKDAAFFDLFDAQAAHVASCAQRLRRLAHGYPAAREEIEVIHAEEREADELTHRVLDRLNHAFLPPFDREDVHTLAGELDDVIDAIDGVSRRFDLYRVDAMEPIFVRQTDVLAEVAARVSDAVHQLRKTRRLSDLGPLLVEIHRLESAGDENHYAALARLFDGTSPPLFVLKWKEIHTLIEDAIDDCDDVSNTLERIALKH